MDWAAVEGIVYSGKEDHPHDILRGTCDRRDSDPDVSADGKGVMSGVERQQKEYPMDLEDEEGFSLHCFRVKKFRNIIYHVDFEKKRMEKKIS